MDNWTEATTFAGLLKEYRFLMGLTQAELARRAGISVRGIQHLESGGTRPYRHTREQLALALGLCGTERARFEDLALPMPRRRPTVRSAAATSASPTVSDAPEWEETAWVSTADAVAHELATTDGHTGDPSCHERCLANQTARLLALTRWGQTLLSDVSAILERHRLIVQPQPSNGSGSISGAAPYAA